MKNINETIENSWKKIAPFWPLKNLIACNPLQGFEDLPFDKALKKGFAHFKNNNMPQELEKINLHTIKWCQIYFDEGQSTIKMPKHEEGFYKAFTHLAVFDIDLNNGDKEKSQFIANAGDDPLQAITKCLNYLEIKEKEREEFLTLILTTLPGWASYIKYLGQWSDQKYHQNILIEYLAVRLLIVCLTWTDAVYILDWYKENEEKVKVNDLVNEIQKNENDFQKNLINKIDIVKKIKHFDQEKNPDAQLVFCIDVRSEPFRKALEDSGNYQTFGFAGFFGIPVAIENEVTNSSYSSCPVLLKPKYKIKEKSSNHHHEKEVKSFNQKNYIKNFYQSLKYNFTTPIALAEAMGIFSATYMAAKSVAPKLLNKIENNSINLDQNNFHKKPDISAISFEEKLAYAKGALSVIGLTKSFSKIIVLCGHGSATQNNSYETALDCGACGGRHGGSNAKIMAEILNDKEVREGLKNHEIIIPNDTIFIAALHNTTSDEVIIYSDIKNIILDQLKTDLIKAREINNYQRALKMGYKGAKENAKKFIEDKTLNWAETRPEWGLARNAAFIVAPRELTKNINLDGRCFLHSYDYKQDENLSALELILCAPMVVAQWINSQYLFSTIDNVAFGSGSKITHNITGKVAIMQGNGSDIMHGLPLQSVYADDEKNFHQPLRLTTIIYAPTEKVKSVITKHKILQTLFLNGWVNLIVLNPTENKFYKLKRDFEFAVVK